MLAFFRIFSIIIAYVFPYLINDPNNEVSK